MNTCTSTARARPHLLHQTHAHCHSPCTHDTDMTTDMTHMTEKPKTLSSQAVVDYITDLGDHAQHVAEVALDWGVRASEADQSLPDEILAVVLQPVPRRFYSLLLLVLLLLSWPERTRSARWSSAWQVGMAYLMEVLGPTFVPLLLEKVTLDMTLAAVVVPWVKVVARVGAQGMVVGGLLRAHFIFKDWRQQQLQAISEMQQNTTSERDDEEQTVITDFFQSPKKKKTWLSRKPVSTAMRKMKKKSTKKKKAPKKKS